MPKGYYPGRNNWTQAELEQLVYMAHRGYLDAEIAAALGRTTEAVRVKRKRIRLYRRGRSGWLMSAHEVARVMGIDGCGKTVARWIQRGWLKGHKAGSAGPYRRWCVGRDALFDFVADPKYFPVYDPERIRDPELRAHAIEARRGRRYLRPGEVARRYWVTTGAVNQWIHRGLLPAVKWGNWWVPEDALDSFVPPCERPKQGLQCRRWTPEEDHLLVSLVAQQRKWRQIATALKRSVNSVYSRYYRLTGGRDGQRGMGAHLVDMAVRQPMGSDAPSMAHR